MSELSGRMVALRADTLGDEVVVDSGTSGRLVVGDAADFDEDGGSVLVDGVTLTYTAVEETTVPGVDDPAELVLTAPSGADVPAGTPVAALVEGLPVVEYVASVLLDGQDSGDPVEAEVDHSLAILVPQSQWAQGGYEVTLADDGDELRVVQVHGKVPEVDLAYAVPGSIPVPPLTDGSPPASSPTPTLTGLARLFLAKWAAVVNADAVTYDVHASLTSGFTPDGTTLHSSTAATVAAVEALPDGTPLAYGVPYYVRIVARDGDGAAAAGAEASVQLDPNGTADISVGAVTAATLESVLVLAGKIATASSGRRIELDSSGLILYDSNGDQLVNFPTDAALDALVDLDVVARSLTAIGPVSQRDANNEIAQGGRVILRAGTTAPVTAPTVAQTVEWAHVDGNPAGSYGAANDGTNFARVSAGLWDWTIQSYDSTGASLGYTGGSGFAGRGCAVIGTSRYLLGIKEADSKWYLRRYNSTWSTLLDEWQLFGGSTAGSDRQPALGTDGTDLLIARTDGTDLIVRKHSATTGAQLSTVNCGAFANTHFAAVMLGSFDYGATRWVVATRDRSGGDVTRVYDSTGTRVSAEEWTLADAICGGALWDGTRFRHFSRSAERLYRYTTDTWTASGDSTRRVANTWVHPTSGETLMGAKATYTAKKRWQTAVTIPDLPAGVGSASLYLNKNTDTGPTSFWRQASGVTARTTTLPTPTWSGTNPPGSSTYPAGSPGGLESDSGLTYIRGDDTRSFAGDPYMSRQKNAAQTLPTASTFTKVTFQTAVDAAVQFASHNDTWAAPWPGKYLVHAQVTLLAGTSGRRMIGVFRDSTEIGRAEVPATAVRATLALTVPVLCAGGDDISVQAFFAGPTTLDVEATSTRVQITFDG